MKLLAIIIGAESAAACLDGAAVAARSIEDASIEALNVVVDPENIIAASEEIEFQRLRERDEGTPQQRADAAHTAFVAWNAGAGEDTPRVTWRSIVGREEAVVVEEARAADAIVFAREKNMDSGDALHAAVFTADKPVFLIPSTWRAGARRTFAHVVVGLSDSDAARRAIEAAAPWLRHAGRVTELRIGAADDPALALESVIDTIGVQAERHVVPRSGNDLGAQLVAEADAIGADLLVTGAYRHNQLVEWLMGGTTRHLLAAADLPLLMVH